MKPQLLDLLVCPACLPEERPLKAHIEEARQGDIHAAELTCPACRKTYPVRQGVGCLLPDDRDSSGDKYAESQAVSAYLWSHFADLIGDSDGNTAYRTWAELLADGESGPALDTGCAVGRLTFEVAGHVDLAIGIDRSFPFVETARRLAREGRLGFGLVMEGTLTEHREVQLPAAWRTDRVDFLVADAQALPFPKSLFRKASSLNLLDKLPAPLQHLRELNRVTSERGSRLVVSDPWSWSAEIAPPEAWLGGTATGPYAGHGHVVVRRLLEGELVPSWQVIDEGTVSWTVRNHRNHFERIHSDYLLASR